MPTKESTTKTAEVKLTLPASIVRVLKEAARAEGESLETFLKWELISSLDLLLQENRLQAIALGFEYFQPCYDEDLSRLIFGEQPAAEEASA